MVGRATWSIGLAAAALLVPAAPATAAHGGGDVRTLELGGKECPLIEVPTAAPVGIGRCPGVRPGALVETRVGFCTMNFLFRDRDGRRYIGTAGHCILGAGRLRHVSERQWTKGPVARDSRGRRIGRFRYAILRGEKDFALIRLNRGSNPSASMCHFGGPTGIDGTRPSGLVKLQHYGQGVVTGDLAPARTFTAKGMRDRDHVFAEGAVTPGDSGGPVTRRSTGGGVGLVVTVGVHVGGSAFDSGTVGITRVPPQKKRAQRVIGERLRLLRAPAK